MVDKRVTLSSFERSAIIRLIEDVNRNASASNAEGTMLIQVAKWPLYRLRDKLEKHGDDE